MHALRKGILLAGASLWMAGCRFSDAAVFVLEQELFSADPAPHFTMLSGSDFNASSGYEGSIGSTLDIETGVGASGGSSPSGSGSFEGSFDAVAIPGPRTGTLRITDPRFLADYDAAHPGYASYFLGFAFYGSALPSDFLITIGNASDTYVYNALPQVTSAGAWNDVYISFSSGWLGSGSSIPDPLNAMTYIDISWSWNQTSAQQFYLDDFTLFGDESPGGGGSAVPEPGTGMLILGGLALLRAAFNRRASA